MPSALPSLARRSAVVLGSVALGVPLLAGLPASGVGAARSSVAPRTLVGAATLVAPPAARPVTPEVDEVPVPDRERPGAPDLVAQSTPQPVDGYGVVGVTWQGDEPRTLELQLRTRDEGRWSAWQELPYDADHAPDPGTAEAAAAVRPGTDAVAVGEVDAVQVRASSTSGEAPRDLELSVVDPGTSPADDDAATVTTPVGAEAARSGVTYVSRSATVRTFAPRTASNPRGVRAPRPRIRSRKAWGANERLRSGSPSYGTVKAGFVHHTVSQNKYTRAQVPGIIRGIYAYHTRSLNWSDVGYNFLVDRFGRIWQGRAGDLRRNVIGAHTYGYNHVAFAMSAIGNFEKAQPRKAMLRAYGKLMGWRLGKWRIAAGDRAQYMEGKRFHAINGHRDAGSTACPGRNLYAKLARIRRLARLWQRYGRLSAPDGGGQQPPPDNNNPPPDNNNPPPVEPPPVAPPPEPDRLRDLQSDGFPDLLVRNAATSRLQVLVGDGGPGFANRHLVNDNVGGAMLFTGVGDVTGDDREDLLVRNGRTKVAKVRPGGRHGGFGPPIASTRRFTGSDLIAGVGNMVGNRRPDVIARDAETGRVWVYRGLAGGKWGRKHLLIRDGRGLSMLGRAGDLDRNGTRDLIARSGRRLVLYPGRGNGRVGSPRTIARGWAGKDLTVGGYDVTGDGNVDVVARDRSTKRTWIYLTSRTGQVKGRFGGWRGWRDLDRLTGVGDVTGDGQSDILGRADGEALVVFPSLGTRWLQGPLDTGRAAGNADFLQAVGDWDGDGHPDVVARSGSNGIVRLYRGTGDQTLRKGVVLARHWGQRTFLVGPGDLSGDGLPDLLSRDQDGVIWLHPSNGRTGMDRRSVARQRIFRTDMVAAAGRWNGDRTRDVIVRKARTKELYLLPGTRKGTLGRAVPLAGGRDFGDYDRILGVGDFNGDRRPDILARESRRGRLWLFAGSASGLKGREYVASGMGRFDLLG